jgi:hypothetical protein
MFLPLFMLCFPVEVEVLRQADPSPQGKISNWLKNSQSKSEQVKRPNPYYRTRRSILRNVTYSSVLFTGRRTKPEWVAVLSYSLETVSKFIVLNRLGSWRHSAGNTLASLFASFLASICRLFKARLHLISVWSNSIYKSGIDFRCSL